MIKDGYIVDLESLNICKKYIRENCFEILSEFHIVTLSNMLNFHYSLSNEYKNLDDFLSICLIKINKFINNKVIFDNDFSTSLALFIAAIQKEGNDDKDIKQNLLSNELSELIVNSVCKNIEAEYKNMAIEIVKELLNSKSISDCVNLLYSEPDLLGNYIKDKAYNKTNIKASCDFIKEQSQSFVRVNDTKRINYSLFKTTTTLLSASLFMIGATFLGVAAPLLIIPATIISISIGNKINHSIGMALNNKDNYQNFNILPSNIPKTKQNKSIAILNSIDKTKIKEVFESTTLKENNHSTRFKTKISKKPTSKTII